MSEPRQYTSRISTARRLRRDATGPEKLLWSRLRGKQIHNIRFRRQQPIGPYVVDFYCAELKLIIELDGDSHLTTAAEDDQRETFLRDQGLHILRFLNDEVLRDVDWVVGVIADAVAPAPHPALPLEGGGK